LTEPVTRNPLERLSLEQLRRRTSAKWTMYDADVLPLWVAEMDVMPAEPVREALERAVRDGDTGYPGRTSYAEALALFASDRWGWSGLDPARTALVADVMTGATQAIRLLTEQGSSVVVNPPVYPPFFGFVEGAGRTVVEAPLREGRLDPDALEQAFVEATGRGRPAAYLLCSPHNPTGTVHTPEELTAVAELAERHGVRVVVDEIHAPLVLDGARFTPYLSLAGTETAFSVMSASKAWNLAGLKAAVLTAGADAVADLERLPWVVGHGVSHFGVIAHTAALTDGRDWLDALLAALEHNRRLLGELVEWHLPQVRWTPPQATYLAWFDCTKLGLDADPAEVFLERARVALNEGPSFGTGGIGHVRLNYATSRSILTEAVERMAAAVG
jgi:cystathionine beta-lyase